MTTQITVFLDPSTMPVRTQDQQTFDNNWSSILAKLPTFVSQANTLTNEVNANATAASSAAASASASASAASAAATTAQQTANASMWSSGTTYTNGGGAISAINYQTYRRKSAGSSATDPANDPTNWTQVLGTPTPTASNTQTSATSITLTSASAGLQTIAMTALGQSVTLPNATTMAVVGGPFFVLRNNGAYSFGIRDNSGTLLMAVAPGGTAYVSLESKATAAGVWGISGFCLEPGLITLDQTLSTTFLGTVFAAFVALDANTSLHFAALSSGFAAFVVDNTGKTVGTPVTVSATANSVPVAAFKTATGQAIVFFGASATDHQAVVLTVTGTAIAVGTAAALTYTATNNSWGGEDSKNGPRIAQLTGTLYVAGMDTNTPTTSAVAISVSGAAVTIGTPLTVVGAANSAAIELYALTATTALIIYGTSLSSAVITVSGTTCSAGAVASSGVTSSGQASTCLLSATKVIALGSNGSNVVAAVGTISGTTVTWGAALTVAVGAYAETSYNANGANRYNPHLLPLGANTALLWYDQAGAPNASVACVLTESGGTLTKGTVLYGSFCSAASGNSGYGAVAAQNTTDFLAVTQHGTAGAWRKLAVPHKINGTTITNGVGEALPELAPAVVADAVPAVRLSQGDYLLYAPNASDLPVLRSNGDMVTKRGAISLPNLNGPSAYPLAAVSSNRLLLAAQTAGSTNSATVQQLRLLNIEVAA